MRETPKLSFEEFLNIAQSECGIVFRGDPEMEAIAREILDLQHSEKLIKTLLGESGVGKEGVARSIHRASERRHGSFVAVNGGNLRGDLIQNELFGHEKGSYTGAAGFAKGAFGAAKRGTLFLDEIGDLNDAAQVATLRALSGARKGKRVGGEEYDLDSNIVCATNRGLGHLRTDFRSRVSACVLYIPPLAERDINHQHRVIEYLVEQRTGRNAKIEPRAADFLLHCLKTEEGNGRWLDDRIQTAYAYTKGRSEHVITMGDAERSVNMYKRGMELGKRVKAKKTAETGFRGQEIQVPLYDVPADENLFSGYLHAAKRKIIQEAIDYCNGSASKAAKLLGLHRSNMYRVMKGLGMLSDASDGKEPVDEG